jgi:hypothetical protein
VALPKFAAQKSWYTASTDSGGALVSLIGEWLPTEEPDTQLARLSAES